MRAQLKSIWSESIDVDLQSFLPENSDNFWLQLTMQIGPCESIGSDYFNLQVCTPKALSDLLLVEKFSLGRGLFIVKNFDYQLIINSIDEFVSSIERESWEEILKELVKYFSWEYDDYD